VKTLPRLQTAIEKLSRKEFWELVKWIDERRNEVWDREMEEDARPGGPLDKLWQEALAEERAGLTRPLEEVIRFRPSGARQQHSRRRGAGPETDRGKH
jgi:hypothetical protein